MSDLDELMRALAIKVAGANVATGDANNYWQVDAFGSGQVGIYNAAGTALTTVTNGARIALDVISQASGPVSPGTAATYSSLMGGQYSSVLPTVTNGQQVAVQVDANGRLIVSPATVLNVEDVWNVASVNGNVAVTTTPVRIKVGASELAGRKVFYIQPQDGQVWVGSSNSVSTVVGNANVGVLVFQYQTFPMIFTNNVQIWMVAASGTVNVSVIEGS